MTSSFMRVTNDTASITYLLFDAPVSSLFFFSRTFIPKDNNGAGLLSRGRNSATNPLCRSCFFLHSFHNVYKEQENRGELKKLVSTFKMCSNVIRLVSQALASTTSSSQARLLLFVEEKRFQEKALTSSLSTRR